MRRRPAPIRRRAALPVGILLAAIMSDMMVSSTSCCRHGNPHDNGMQPTSTSTRISQTSTSIQCYPSTQNGAFVFSRLKRRRKENVAKEPAVIVEKINGDSENNLVKNGKVNGNSNNGHTIHHGLVEKTNGHQNQLQLDQTQFLDMMDIVEDEPYATMHPVQNAYNKLSKLSTSAKGQKVSEAEPTTLNDIPESSLESMSSMEGNDDAAYYVRASHDLPNDESIEDREEFSMWDRRNARSIDEGVRFKSQLREGLEEQSKLHRERMLGNLLEGVIDGTKGALKLEKEKMKNATSPFRWLGFGRGDNKDGDSQGKGKKKNKNKKRFNNDAYAEIEDIPSTTVTKEIEGKDKPKHGKIGARTITGLIMAVAEEVEGLEVEVDADADTPIRNKSVHSIKIFFSRLGFRQLRMGGLDEAFSELESAMPPSEKFTMATNFFNVGKPKTADEAFDKIDVDKSGSLDEEELAEALKMAAIIGGNKFGMRSKEALAEMASRLVRLYDTNGDGVVDREEYQAMVQDMATLREARLKEELHEQTEVDMISSSNGEKRRGWMPNVFGGKESSSNNTTMSGDGDNNIVDVTENEEFWGSIDHGEGSIVLEDLKLDLRRLLFGAIPGVKRVLPGGPLILKPFTATMTASFDKDDIMDSGLLDVGLRRLVARALSRRVRGIRDLLDGAVFYGRTWKNVEQAAPQVEVAKLEDVQFDKRNRLIITGRAKITEALGYSHEPIEQGFKLRTKIGTRADGRIIGLLQPEIAIFAECPKDLEKTVRSKCKEWFSYTPPTLQPLYTYIPLVSPLKKDDKMDGFNMGEDNQLKSIYIKNGKLRIEFSAFLRPGRFLGNHYLAFTVPNRTLILTLDRVRVAMRNARRNKRLAELAAREVKQLAAAQQAEGGTSDSSGKPSISPEGKARIKRLEKELKATILEENILREMDENKREESIKGFIGRFVQGYSGAIREELDLEMNARLSSSISDFFGSQDRDGEDGGEEI